MICESEIPLCTSCGHRHEQGVKCSICGHVGKSQIFTKMRIRSQEKRIFHLEHFGHHSLALDETVVDLITDIRCSVHNPDLSIAVENKEDSWNRDDNSSSHAISYNGDIPVGSLRYRLSPIVENGANCLVLDKLFVYPHYRSQKMCWKTLFTLFNQLIQSNTSVQQICLITPSNSWLEARALQMGFQKCLIQPSFCTYNPVQESLLILGIESIQNLYDITSYLQNRSNSIA